MVRIAVISTMAGYPWGGSECLWASAAERALIENHEVFLSIYDWSVEHPAITQLQQRGAQLLPRPRFVEPLSLGMRAAKRIKQHIPFLSFPPKARYSPVFDCKPDVICINQGSSYDIVYQPELIKLLNFVAIPYLIVCQFNSDSWTFNPADRTIAQEVFAKAAKVVFVSRQNLKLAERQLAQPLPNAVVAQNPVNLHDFNIVPWCKQSEVRFASVARLETFAKGQDALFEAFSAPVWQSRSWLCSLYGSGPDQDYLETLAQHYGISNHIKFMGHVTDIRAVWAENHMLVLPSRAEGTPLSLVEAMLCGRPAVVTDVGGNTEWVEESKSGFIAEAPTAKSLNAALERAWLAQGDWEQMGVKAHDDAITNFDLSPDYQFLETILDLAKQK